MKKVQSTSHWVIQSNVTYCSSWFPSMSHSLFPLLPLYGEWYLSISIVHLILLMILSITRRLTPLTFRGVDSLFAMKINIISTQKLWIFLMKISLLPSFWAVFNCNHILIIFYYLLSTCRFAPWVVNFEYHHKASFPLARKQDSFWRRSI